MELINHSRRTCALAESNTRYPFIFSSDDYAVVFETTPKTVRGRLSLFIDSLVEFLRLTISYFRFEMNTANHYDIKMASSFMHTKCPAYLINIYYRNNENEISLI